MLPLRLLSPWWVLGCAEERPLPSHKQRSFFFALEDEASKKGQGVCQTLAPGSRIAKGWGLLLCAIHKANVTVAVLFQPLTK